jgi:hypothetical protein
LPFDPIVVAVTHQRGKPVARQQLDIQQLDIRNMQIPSRHHQPAVADEYVGGDRTWRSCTCSGGLSGGCSARTATHWASATLKALCSSRRISVKDVAIDGMD